jgi:hypothetical protein
VSPELATAGDPDTTEVAEAGWRVCTATPAPGPVDPVIATATATAATARIREIKPAIRNIPARAALVGSA